MSEFLDIAKWCRQSQGPDLDLDAALARATGWSQLCSPRWGVHAPHWYKDDRYIGEMIPGWIGGESAVLPPFTAYQDVARLLAPLDYKWTVMEDYELAGRAMLSSAMKPPAKSDGNSMALAMCAAAMEAWYLEISGAQYG